MFSTSGKCQASWLNFDGTKKVYKVLNVCIVKIKETDCFLAIAIQRAPRQLLLNIPRFQVFLQYDAKMGTSFKLAGIIAISSAIYFVFMLQSLYSRAKQAKDWGCKNIFRLPDKLPFGINYVMRMNKADQKHMVPQETMKFYLEAGRPTFAQSVLGSTIITTHEPKNVQHLLSLQFSDFELGPHRRNSFFPMLGNGIFTTDGKMWYVHAYTFPTLRDWWES